MKKKIYVILLLALLSISPLFAFTDSFASKKNDTLYYDLIKNIKDNNPEEMTLASYEAFIAKEKNPVYITRMEYQMVRYYVDSGEVSKAEEHLSKCQASYAEITETGVRKDIAELETVTAEYYIYEKMSTGMQTSNLTKQLYKNYPEEISVICYEANRYLYTPHIAGGSAKKALALFETLLPIEDKLQTLDRFILFSGLGIASKERGQKADALKYLNTAIGIYSGDADLLKAIDDLS